MTEATHANDDVPADDRVSLGEYQHHFRRLAAGRTDIDELGDIPGVSITWLDEAGHDGAGVVIEQSADAEPLDRGENYTRAASMPLSVLRDVANDAALECGAQARIVRSEFPANDDGSREFGVRAVPEITLDV